MRARAAVGGHAILSGAITLALAACATAVPTATPTASPTPAPTATPATTPEHTTPAATDSPTLTPSDTPTDGPSPSLTTDVESLPRGSVVGLPQAALEEAIGLWPPEAYGGWDEPADEGYELVVETPDELFVVDGRSGAVLHTLERPNVAQINAVLVTADSIWLTDHDAGAVLRLDRETGDTMARVTIGTGGARAVSLIETEEGVWAGSGHILPESIVLIDPATNAVGRSIEAGAYPGYGDGSLWFGRDEARSTASGIRRVDPSTGDVLSTIDLNGADGCYVGGSYPDVVWSFCFPPPPFETKAGRLDLTAGEVVAVVPLGAAGSLIGVADGHSWFLVDRSDELPSRVLAVDNETNAVARAFAVSAAPPPFDMAAIIADSLWVLDVEAGELRRIALGDL